MANVLALASMTTVLAVASKATCLDLALRTTGFGLDDAYPSVQSTNEIVSLLQVFQYLSTP